jgi:hypothetical protein
MSIPQQASIFTGPLYLHKKILEEGTGPVPEQGERCIVHVVGDILLDKSQSEKHFCFSTYEHNDGNPLIIEAGADQTISGLDSALLDMHEGEKCEVVLLPWHAYGSLGNRHGFHSMGKPIPPNASLLLTIQLVYVHSKSEAETERQLRFCTREVKADYFTKRKQLGNDSFNRGLVYRAQAIYRAVLSCMEAVVDPADLYKDLHYTTTFRSCLLNLGACALKSKNYKECKFLSERVLHIFPGDLTALVRHGVALAGTGANAIHALNYTTSSSSTSVPSPSSHNASLQASRVPDLGPIPDPTSVPTLPPAVQNSINPSGLGQLCFSEPHPCESKLSRQIVDGAFSQVSLLDCREAAHAPLFTASPKSSDVLQPLKWRKAPTLALPAVGSNECPASTAASVPDRPRRDGLPGDNAAAENPANTWLSPQKLSLYAPALAAEIGVREGSVVQACREKLPCLVLAPSLETAGKGLQLCKRVLRLPPDLSSTHAQKLCPSTFRRSVAVFHYTARARVAGERGDDMCWDMSRAPHRFNFAPFVTHSRTFMHTPI